MTLLVRNEEDIIAENIRFHSAMGVDSFIVMDNLSTDATPRILRQLAKDYEITYLFQPRDDYNQSQWVTQMAHRAASEHGADWVINNDADEMWLPRDGDLKDCLGTLPLETAGLLVARHNAVLVCPSGSRLNGYCHPTITRHFECVSHNNLGGPLPHKVLHRTSAAVTVAQGNHDVAGLEGAVVEAGDRLRILHFPYRTLGRYEEKILVGGAAYQRNQNLPKTLGATWRTHYRQLQTSNLDAFWTERSRTPEELEADLQAGRYFEDGRIADFLAPNANSKGASSLRPVFNRLLDTTRSDVSDLAKQHTQLIDNMPQCERQEHPLHYNFPFILNGPNAHLQRLEELSNRGSADELCAEFGSLRDAISLFPRNNGIKPFLGALLQSTHAAATERLRADCDGKRVMLHTSCQHRLAETEKTVASFDRGGTGLHHVILLGDVTSRTEDETPLSFDYDGRVLSVPVPDTYEHLHRKMFYSYMILDVLTQPALLVKVDDNVLMQDFDRFVACLDKVEANSAGYAGRRVGADRHDAQWHGWHIGKCADPQIQTRGFQYPLPRDYAAGGYGYVLGPQGLAACSYMYLAMKAFFAMRVVGLEDAYVGLAAYAQGLELMDISDAQTLLVLPGLTTKERQRHIDGVTAN